MSESTHEELLGYLLGALEETEEESLRERLKADPQLRQALGHARQSLRLLEAAPDDGPTPPGLADRTCDYVAHWAATHTPLHADVTTTLSPLAAPAGVTSAFRWPDLAVSTSVCFVALALVFPTLLSKRFEGRVTACQENLRVVSQALHSYSQRYDGYFPTVPTQGRFAAAGIYAPTLMRTGYLDQPQAVLCPASQTSEGNFHVPSLEELQSAPAERVPQLHNAMGGSYGYSLGHLANGRYQGTRDRSRPRFALVADAPSENGDHQSRNHDGRGQNVLFEDGHVVFLGSAKAGPQQDDIFLNDAGQVDAGLHEDDAVIAPSPARPINLVPVSLGR